MIEEGRNAADREALADRIELERLGARHPDEYAAILDALRELGERLDRIEARRAGEK